MANGWRDQLRLTVIHPGTDVERIAGVHHVQLGRLRRLGMITRATLVEVIDSVRLLPSIIETPSIIGASSTALRGSWSLPALFDFLLRDGLTGECRQPRQ